MRYRYEGHGLLVERIDAKKQTLGYRYDKVLRVTELVNGNGESYFFGYDAEAGWRAKLASTARSRPISKERPAT